MRTKLASVLLSLIAIVTLLPETSPISGKCSDYTVGEIQALADGIVAYELGNAGAGDIQDWIYGPLTSNAGESSEWFVLTLSQSGSYDFSTYEAALVEYLSHENIQSASSREKYALALIASGSTNRYITQAIENSTGQQGIAYSQQRLHERKFHAGKRCRVYHFHAAFGRRLGNNGQLQRC